MDQKDRERFTRALGCQMRYVRERRLGMSLDAVQKLSEGRWTASAVGSWERGSRAVLVEKLDGLARFYGVRVVDLLPAA